MKPIIIPDAAIEDYERRNRKWLDVLEKRKPQTSEVLPEDIPLELKQFLEDL